MNKVTVTKYDFNDTVSVSIEAQHYETVFLSLNLDELRMIHQMLGRCIKTIEDTNAIEAVWRTNM